MDNPYLEPDEAGVELLDDEADELDPEEPEPEDFESPADFESPEDFDSEPLELPPESADEVEDDEPESPFFDDEPPLDVLDASRLSLR